MVEGQLGDRQQSVIGLSTSDPLGVDEQLALWIDELVSVADGSITDGSHSRDLFSILRLTYKV